MLPTAAPPPTTARPVEGAARERMSNVDHAWLRMDEPGNRMTITGLLFFAEPIPLDDLRRVIAERLLPIERFSQRVVRRGARAYWETVAIDLETRVQPLELAAPADRAVLERTVGELMSEPLDLTAPLWQFHLVDFDGGSVVITRLHHCIGDGLALMMVLLSLTELEAGGDGSSNPLAALFRGGGIDDGVLDHVRELLPEGMRLMVRPTRGALPGSRTRLLGRLGRDLARLVLRRRDSRTPFKGPLGDAKVAAWSRVIELDELKALKEVLGATINDLLLSAVTGALRRYLETRQHLALDLRAVVPVSLRPLERMASLGNQFGLVFLALPVGVAPVRERLHELRRRMGALKGSLEAGLVLGLLHVFGGTPQVAQRLAVRIFGTKGTAVVTNVPGPRQTLYLAGRPIHDLLFWVPQSGRLGMGISIVSYAGRVRIGVTTDRGLVPDPQRIVDGVYEELAAMREAAGLSA